MEGNSAFGAVVFLSLIGLCAEQTLDVRNSWEVHRLGSERIRPNWVMGPIETLLLLRTFWRPAAHRDLCLAF